jgi:hypothetical protein
MRAVLLFIVVTAAGHAQRVDSARVAAPHRTPVLDTVTRAALQPPISPQRAFLYSLILPGFGESRLGRPTAGAIFVFTEAIGLTMLRESKADLREAQRFRADSTVVIGNDPATGLPVTETPSFNDELVSVRRLHVQDWVAFLIFNHLFSGADAYVAAHLWDLPSQINVSQTPAGSVVLAARVSW